MPPAMSSSASTSGIALPHRAKGVGELAAAGRTAAMKSAVRHGSCFTQLPRAAITALIPVGGGGGEGRQPLLGRPKPRLGEMLRRAPGAEPGVVGRVEDERGPVELVDDVAGEDDLV